jgi:uncharacterized membrane protein YeaQ/YmgE (transglycosylase-associated protein family)
MLYFVTWLIVGGIIGWLASTFLRSDAEQGTLLNVVVGVVGAVLAGLVLTPLLGIATNSAGRYSLPALLVALLGAVVLPAVVNRFRFRIAR